MFINLISFHAFLKNYNLIHLLLLIFLEIEIYQNNNFHLIFLFYLQIILYLAPKESENSCFNLLKIFIAVCSCFGGDVIFCSSHLLIVSLRISDLLSIFFLIKVFLKITATVLFLHYTINV